MNLLSKARETDMGFGAAFHENLVRDGSAHERGAGPPAARSSRIETCTGCHACVLACANENQLAPGTTWRQVVTFNPGRAPRAPAFHLSLACNHCLDAPCLHALPGAALSRGLAPRAQC